MVGREPGKSSLVAGLTRALESSGRVVADLHLDDFARDLPLSPADVPSWLARGADPQELRSDGMEQALRRLLSSTADDGRAVEVVLVEDPFGRARPPFDETADLVLHLRLPPAVALARRLLRDVLPAGDGLDAAGLARLRHHLTSYAEVGDDLYDAVDSAALRGADLVLDATADLATSARLAEEAVLARLAALRAASS